MSFKRKKSLLFICKPRVGLLEWQNFK
uniref:Uncharacterized protein n=1 Tax=Anguilla anguilla TaxID=7936 RepID=A0A0E9TVB3_ANGAN